MVINGTTNNTRWTYKMEVNEISSDILNKTSVVQIKTYIGRASSQAPIGGSYSITAKCAGQTQTQSGTIQMTDVAGGAWLYLKTFTFTVENKGTQASPTKASVSTTMSSSAFTPSSCSASGEITLTVLHTDPVINRLTLTEKNSKLTRLGVANNVIVQFLSNKTSVINVKTYDNATITKYDIYHNNVLIGSGTSNTITINFANVSELADSGTKNIGLMVSVVDNLGGSASKMFSFPIIKYTKPAVGWASTSIRRKTGGGVVLTDNKAVLNFVGMWYKGNDVVGNNNKPTVKYKIWENEGSEPAYSNLTVSNVATVEVKNYEINNLIYTKTYNYKIYIYDNYITEDSIINVKSDKVPTGVSVWTEYKDRVDFEKITIKGEDISSSLKKELNIASAWLVTNKLITMTAWESYLINLDGAVIIGDKLTLENGYIKIGAGVKKVRISGSAYFGMETPNTEIRSWFTTYDVSGNAVYGVPSFGRKAYNTNVMLNIPTRILDVEEGYTIRLTAQIGANGDVPFINRGTTLNVEVIE